MKLDKDKHNILPGSYFSLQVNLSSLYSIDFPHLLSDSTEGYLYFQL